MKKSLAFVLVLVLVASIVAASGRQETPDDGVIELVVWNTWADHHVAAFQEILDSFNAQNPDIHIVQQSQPLANYEAKVMQAVREGTGPDFIDSFPTVAANYIEEGMLANLSPYINDPQIGIPGFREQLPEGAYRTVTQWDGNVYLVPFSVGGEVFYYNRTLFNRLNLDVPTTWDELEAAGRVILRETGRPAFGFDQPAEGLQVLMMQRGSGYIDPETKTVRYNNPIAVERLEWFSNLVKEGVFRLVGEDVYFSNPFGSEAIASYIGSPAGYGFVRSAVDNKFDFGVAPIPQGGPHDYTSYWGYGYIVFSSTEARQRASYRFIRHLMQPEVLASWSRSFGVVPSLRSAIELPSFQAYAQENPVLRASIEQMDYVGFLSSIRGSSAIRTILARAVVSASTGIMTPAEALENAEREGNAELMAY